MATQGETSLDFGAFPGKSDATVSVSGLTTETLAEAWIYPKTTADHTEDEHIVETIQVRAGRISGGAFTIYGWNTNQINEPLEPLKGASNVTLAGTLNTPNYSQQQFAGGRGTRIYGVWNVAWAAN